VGRGGEIWPSQAQRARARALAQLRPNAGDGVGARGDDAVAVGPHASESVGGGGDGATVDGGANQPSAWREPRRRWAQRRFAAGDPVLWQWVGGLARAGVGEPRGGLDLVRGGRGGGCPRGGGGASWRGCRR
jgi:hypothetical protein